MVVVVVVAVVVKVVVVVILVVVFAVVVLVVVVIVVVPDLMKMTQIRENASKIVECNQNACFCLLFVKFHDFFVFLMKLMKSLKFY